MATQNTTSANNNSDTIENQYSDKNQYSDMGAIAATDNDPVRMITSEQDTLLRGVVHDVNNNLMAILAGCDQLEHSIDSPEDSRPLLESIRNHISMASQLVNDLTRNNNNEDNQVVMTQYELENLLKGIVPSLTLVTSNKVTIEIGSSLDPISGKPSFLRAAGEENFGSYVPGSQLCLVYADVFMN